jgi:glycosyltransferase involved in cell wall biosynthesis
MADVLLTVSGVIPDDVRGQVAAGRRPRPDYLAMADAFGADLVDYAAARRGSAFGRLLEKAGGRNLMLAWECFRRRGDYRVLFTDGEQVGIPLALLLKLLGWTSRLRGRRRPRHLMIVHVLSVPKKLRLMDAFRLHTHIDTFLVYATWQQRFIRERWGIAAGRVVFTPFMVDASFFAPGQVAPQRQEAICAVGLERRDYPTLMEAVRGLDARVVIAAASPWSKQSDTTAGQAVPDNVEVRKFTQYELRQLYADCRFMVMPLFDVDFQAGVTAILEAMAMGRAVVCSRTRGQTDVIRDGENGLYVPPGDARALRETIVALLGDPERADRLGLAGRRLVEQEMSLEAYVERLKRVVDSSTTTSTST